MEAEKRKAKRVEFFQVGGPQGIEPVWVIQHTSPDAVLGLLVDIGADGVQILTRGKTELDGKSYQLMVQTDTRLHLMSAVVKPRWSRPEGTMYHRNGFAFEEGQDAGEVDNIMAARQGGHMWLRCELLPV